MSFKGIVIHGQKGVGKDTVGAYIAEQLGWECTGFAWRIKEIYCDLYGISPEELERLKRNDETYSDHLITVRQSLQLIGNTLRAYVHPDTWIDAVLRRSNIVVCDGRYENEAVKAKERGFLNICIYRPGYENDDPHPSEVAIGRVAKTLYVNNGVGNTPHEEAMDYLILNDGSVADLHASADYVLHITGLDELTQLSQSLGLYDGEKQHDVKHDGVSK